MILLYKKYLKIVFKNFSTSTQRVFNLALGPIHNQVNRILWMMYTFFVYVLATGFDIETFDTVSFKAFNWTLKPSDQ